MDLYEVIDQVVALLRSRKRVTYLMLGRQFDLDADIVAVLKEELLFAHPEISDEQGRGLVWTEATEPSANGEAASAPGHAPLAYTPPYLTEKILTSRAVLEGERKQVTVLFADIKDSTELIRDLDPEAAQQLLDPAIHLMMQAVHRFEGTVNQVLGDGIMSIFGAPIAHEDHAARACYAALAMQAAMQPYASEVRRARGIEMQMRVGLNSGEVVVRAIGNDLHMDYSAVGATTHLAARMEQLARPGSTRLSASTLRLVEGLVQVDALGPIPVKGMPEPVEAYELTGASSVRRRLQAAAARGLTQFVGRDTEIEALHQALQRAGSGQGQLVAAVGEAGVGKSRLTYEVARSHRTRGWLVLESASVSYGQATPYFPVIDLLERYVRVEEGDDPRTIRAKTTGQILTLDETLQDAIPALLSLLDALPADSPFLQLDPLQRRRRILDGLKRVLLRESQAQPLLLVFEDLHWIDAETQALLDSLIESLPTAQMLLLVNYRPEYQHAWGGKTFYTQLRLDPLSPASADAFLDALLGDDASLAPLHQLLIERTEGNPFFLEESVQTLVETGTLAGEPGAYRLTQDLPTIQVPVTVQAILAARIDRLPPEDKHLLQTAAVIGSEAPLTLLQAIADLPEASLYRGLAHLQAAEFIYETSLFPERVYTFKHALTHDVAYGSLLQERRRILHARIVAALESVADDRGADQVDRLAHHALRGECWEKAVFYLRQAGSRAIARSAFQAAETCFKQALSALAHMPESQDMVELAIDLRFDLRNVLFVLGEREQAHTYLQQAKTLAESLDDPLRLGRALAHLGFYFRIIGDLDRSISCIQQGMSLATACGDFALQIQTYHFLGRSYFAMGDYRQAIDVWRWVIDRLEGDQVYERFDLPILPAAAAWAELGVSLAETGEFAEGLSLSQEGTRMAEAGGHLFSQMMSQFFMVLLYLRKGEFARTLLPLERLYALIQGQETSFFAFVPHAATALGYAYLRSGRPDEALPLLDQAAAQGFSGGLAFTHAIWWIYLSEAFLLANRVAEARQHAERALALSIDHQGRGEQAHALRLLGEIALSSEPLDIESAQHHYQQALALANELGMRPLQAHCHRGLGALYRQAGQASQARPELSTAIEMYRAMEMDFWLPETEAVFRHVSDSNRPPRGSGTTT